jgi:long-chain fatty acid transport protein
MTLNRKLHLRASVCILALCAAATGAQATDGYFVEGASAREQALGGAGSANPGDSLTNANNPAGLVDVGHQINGDISAFAPTRGYNASGTMLTAPGAVSSGRDIFAIPTLGYAVPLSADSALGASMVANGGMNTSYSGAIPNAVCAGYHSPMQGVFCGGRAGVDLNQALISIGYAQRFGNLSVGVAPILAVQMFSAYGLGAMGMFGLSSNPAELTNHSPSYSVGGGVRAGARDKVSQQV